MSVTVINQIKMFEQQSGGLIGLYAKHIETGAKINYRETEPFFMASTLKLPLTIAFIRQLEKGLHALDDMIQLKPSDLRPASYILSRFENDMAGVQLSLQNLIQYNLEYSDNAATDILFGVVGGPETVQATLDELAISDIKVSRTVLEIAKDLYGFQVNSNNIQKLKQFEELIEAVPHDISKQAREIFVNNTKKDSTTPKAMAALLESIYKAEIIHSTHRDLILSFMRNCKTFKDRMPGLLPKGTVVARKTGTMDYYAADIGIITLPQKNGHVILTVYIKKAKYTGGPLNRIVAEISRTVYDYFLFSNENNNVVN